MNTDEKINLFFKSKSFAVVGASSNREKYGNKVLRCYMQHNKKVIPVNLNEKKIEGLNTVENISQLDESVESLSMITPPAVTEKIVEQAIKTKHIKNIWMQPGAESRKAIDLCEKNNINVIANGVCILVVLGYTEH